MHPPLYVIRRAPVNNAPQTAPDVHRHPRYGLPLSGRMVFIIEQTNGQFLNLSISLIALLIRKNGLLWEAKGLKDERVIGPLDGLIDCPPAIRVLQENGKQVFPIFSSLAVVVRNARGVREELPDGDLPGVVFASADVDASNDIARKVFRDRIIQG